MDDWDDPSLSYDGQPAAPLAPLSGTPLGRGAQGVVVSGQDRHLPREVAWKSASRSDPKACLRLRHEARVLAMLEHPNIVPVYDLDDLGSHLRMALRYVRGASLRTHLRREPFAPGSVRAIRHVLAVAHALAFAHLRGVVHRDVKPDNIMVGEQGETQLIDWGLAAVLDDHDPVGGVTGTPLYMSPEQARGERPTPSVDVWALGAILYELAIGRPLWALAATPIESGEIASDAKPILEELRLGRRPHLDLRSLPEELAAIITRALAPEPEARYHDAGSFADDLEAFLDGRIVAAHTYSRWQRLKRFARRWRLAFGIGLAVLVTLAIGLPVAFVRISDERDDAIAARQEVTRQLARAETTIAQREHEAGRRPEAELAAAKVLALTESPEARGILAAWARAPRPEPLVTVRPPLWPGPCRDVAVSPDGRHALCGHRSGLVVFDLRTSPPTRAFAIERPYFNATLTNRDLWMSHQPGALMDRVDLETGLRTEHKSCDRNLEVVGELVLDFGSSCAGVFTASGTLLGLESAPGEYFQTMAADRDHLVVLNTKGDMHVVRPDATRTVQTTLASATRDYVTAALWHGPDRDPYVVFGSSRGHIAVLDLDGQVLFERRLLPERVIRDLDVDDRTSRLLVQVEQLGASLLALPSLALLASYPASEATWAGLLDSGVIATAGDALHLRRQPPGPFLHLDDYVGVTSLGMDAHVLTVTHQDSATLLDPDDGGRLAYYVRSGDDGIVIKRALRRGPEILVAVASSGRAPGSSRTDDLFTAVPSTRRLELLPDGRMVRSDTGLGLAVELPDRTWLELDHARQVDLALDGTLLVGLTASPPRTQAWDLAGPPLALASCPDTDALAIAVVANRDDPLTGPVVLSVHPQHIVARDLDCHILGVFAAPHAEPTRVLGIGPPEHGWVVAGTRSGEVLVWDWGGTLRARAVQHIEPVSTLAVDATQRWLLSGSWDGRVRFLDLTVLTEPAAALIQSVRAAWLL